MNSIAMHPLDDLKIAVIGLGYVGLPLAVEFGKSRPVVGFDINSARIAQLQRGQDTTLEVSSDELLAAGWLAVAHDSFRDMSVAQIRALGKADHLLNDLKNVLAEHQSDLRL